MPHEWGNPKHVEMQKEVFEAERAYRAEPTLINEQKWKRLKHKLDVYEGELRAIETGAAGTVT